MVRVKKQKRYLRNLRFVDSVAMVKIVSKKDLLQ